MQGFRKIPGSRVLGRSIRRIARKRRFSALIVSVLSAGLSLSITSLIIFDLFYNSPPFGIESPEELFVLRSESLSPRTGVFVSTRFSYPFFDNLRSSLKGTNVRAAAVAQKSAGFGRGAKSREIRAALVTENFFELVGLHPFLGRLFMPDDLNQRIAILSHRFWREEFSADKNLIGSTCRIANQIYTVVGILPDGYAGFDLVQKDVWLPVGLAADDLRLNPDEPSFLSKETRSVNILVGGGKRSQLRLSGLVGESDDSIDSTIRRILPIPLKEYQIRDSEIAELIAWAPLMSTLVLIIACANVTYLLLVDYLTRSQELRTKLQLGATRTQLLSELACENIVLFILSCVVALLATPAILLGLAEYVLGIRGIVQLTVSWSLIGGVGLVVLATALSAGLLPAWRGSRDAALARHSNVSLARQNRLKFALLCSQITFSCSLIIISGLFLKSLKTAKAVELGFDPNKILLLELPNLSNMGYDKARISNIFERLEAAAKLSTGVESVSLVSARPFGISHMTSLKLNGKSVMSSITGVADNFFGTLDIGIKYGQEFPRSETALGELVVIVNNALASRVFNESDGALGSCLQFFRNKSCATVIGIADNTAIFGFDRIDDPQVFVLLNQTERSGLKIETSALLVRTELPEKVEADLYRSASTLNDIPYVRIRTLTSEVSPQFEEWRRGTRLLSALAAVAVLIALLGCYISVNHSLGQAKLEIGIRMALGARLLHISRVFLRPVALATVVGSVLGILISVALARILQNLFYEVEPTDPAVLLIGIFLLTTVVSTISVCPLLSILRSRHPVELLLSVQSGSSYS